MALLYLRAHCSVQQLPKTCTGAPVLQRQNVATTSERVTRLQPCTQVVKGTLEQLQSAEGWSNDNVYFWPSITQRSYQVLHTWVSPNDVALGAARL